MHEIGANRAAIKAAGLAGKFAPHLQFRVRLRLQKPEWIQIGLEISPPAEGVEYALSPIGGSFQYTCAGSDFAGSCGHGNHY